MVDLKFRLEDAIRYLTTSIMKAAQAQADPCNDFRDELADRLKSCVEVLLQIVREEREKGTRLELDEEPIRWVDGPF